MRSVGWLVVAAAVACGGREPAAAGAGQASPPPLPGSDGGAAQASICEGITPKDLLAPDVLVADTTDASKCGIPVGDGLGTVALPAPTAKAPLTWNLFSMREGLPTAQISARSGDLVPETGGFLAWVRNDSGGGGWFQHFDASTFRSGSGLAVASSMDLVVGADDSAAVLAGHFDSLAGARRAVARTTADGQLQWGPVPLSLDTEVFGVVVDARQRTLVFQNGTGKFGAGCIAAQWFDADGTPMGDTFPLFENFVPGAATWLEGARLVDGGLAIRRVDGDVPGNLHSTWLATLRSGAAKVEAAPAWLASRPDTKLVLARSGTAYAFLPNGRTGGACRQAVELLAADGTKCGEIDIPIAQGTCDTLDLNAGLDGTILQRVAPEFERNAQSCTVRAYRHALR